jgi:two-component system chemotaxis sensor kinase CheA
MDRPQEKAVKDFIAEAEEILESLSDDVEVAYEQFESLKKIKPDLLNKIFREMHSLKGLASMLQLDKITTLSHDMESLLDKTRMGKVKLGPDIFSVLDEARKALRQLIIEVSQGGEKLDTSLLLEKISNMIEGESKKQEPSRPKLKLPEETLKSLTEYEEHRLKENIEEGNRIYSVQVGFSFVDFDVRLKSLTELLNNSGEVISTLPVIDPDITEGIHFKLIYGTNLDENSVRKIVQGENGVVEDLLERGSSTPLQKEEKKEKVMAETAPSSKEIEEEPAKEEESVTEEGEEIKGISNNVKVDIEKLDEVMGLVGELGLIKTSFEKISSILLDISELHDLWREMQRNIRSMDKKLDELQRSIIDIRMVPISQIFTRINRTARRLARQSGKEISIQMYGGETELDKRIMDGLVTPLVHLIRNSIDHGIESAKDRFKYGKSPEGLLVISAYHRGNAIVIEITDDGKGIDYEKIKDVAIKKGIVGEKDILSEQECLDLIFQPGFSSTDKVTEVSGRGVGLDVVKTTVEKMKGSISVWSEKGKGTTFQLILPITLAIIQSLIVKCAGQNYAIPISSVIESFRIKESDIEFVNKKEVYNLRGTTLPIVRLEERFKIKRDKQKENDSLFVVVAKKGEKSAGIVVDDLVGEQETVIHPIGKKLGNLPGVAGATEIGENQVILVIDTASLLSPLEVSRV